MLNIISQNDFLKEKARRDACNIGWGSIGGKPDNKLISYEYCGLNKIAITLRGNVLLCSRYGCVAPTNKDRMICAGHTRGLEFYAHCRSKNVVCLKKPHFGYVPGQGLYCAPHKLHDMFNVIDPTCDHFEKGTKCKTRPNYGSPGDNRRFCGSHKTKDMVDVTHHICDGFDDNNEKCKMRSHYGIIGQSERFCIEHIKPGMNNFTHHTCEYIYDNNEKCQVIASFGLIGGIRSHCATHKDNNMVILLPVCKFEGCWIQPYYGLPGTKAEYCSTHKIDGMIDVRSKRCNYDGSIKCDKLTSWGYPGESRERCSQHSSQGMIDLNDNKCMDSSCMIKASYGYLYSDEHIHCKNHSTNNEYGSPNRFPICLTNYCQDIAYFVDENDATLCPTRCLKCKLNTDIELVEKTCQKCGKTLFIPNNQIICMVCGEYRVNLSLSRKEYVVKEYLQLNSIEFIHNRVVSRYGSRYRPDFLIKTNNNNFKIILEVDEYQHKHKKYTKSDEENRMVTIYKDIQIMFHGARVLFIRYNPDNYKGNSYDSDSDSRLQVLNDVMSHYIKQDTFEYKLGVIYLYYDGYGQISILNEIEIPEILENKNIILPKSQILKNNTLL